MTSRLLQGQFAVHAAVTIGMLGAFSPAFAADASLPYRSYPGFTCLRWNTSNECTDFTYYDTRTSIPRPVYPQYVSGYGYACANSTTDCTGAVTIRVRAIPATVSAGDLLSYTLYVRNDDSQTRSVSVRAFIDTQSTFDSATGGGAHDGNIVRWDGIHIAPRSSSTLVVRVRVRYDAPYGQTLIFAAQTGNSVDSVATRVNTPSPYAASVISPTNNIFLNPYGSAVHFSTVDPYSATSYASPYANNNSYYAPYYYPFSSSSNPYYQQMPGYYYDPSVQRQYLYGNNYNPYPY